MSDEIALSARPDVIRARQLIDQAIDLVELAEFKLHRAGMPLGYISQASLNLTRQHVACSEALR